MRTTALPGDGHNPARRRRPRGRWPQRQPQRRGSWLLPRRSSTEEPGRRANRCEYGQSLSGRHGRSVARRTSARGREATTTGAALDRPSSTDPGQRTAYRHGEMTEARGYHTATPPPDGGCSWWWPDGRQQHGRRACLGRAGSTRRSWSRCKWSGTAHMFHTATLLPDGNVIVTGAGHTGHGLAAAATAQLGRPERRSRTGRERQSPPAPTTAHLLTGRHCTRGGGAPCRSPGLLVP